MSYSKMIARNARPGQFIRTVSGKVLKVTSHEGDTTHLRTTVEEVGPNGVLPADSYDSIKSCAPVTEIRDQL